MTFTQRRYRLTTHLSERIPVVKRRMSVVSVKFQPIYSGIKNRGTQWTGDLLGPRISADRLEHRRSIPPCRESNPRSSSPRHSHCAHWATISGVLRSVWQCGADTKTEVRCVHAHTHTHTHKCCWQQNGCTVPLITKPDHYIAFVCHDEISLCMTSSWYMNSSQEVHTGRHNHVHIMLLTATCFDFCGKPE